MRLVLFLFAGCLCFAQSLALGVRGGFLATDDVSGAAVTESKRYVVGPMADLSLPFGLGLEVDALYRREGYQASTSNFAGSFSERERANVWEFPIVVKYRLGFPLIKPYVAAGYSPRRISGSVDDSVSTVNPVTGQTTISQQHSSRDLDTSHGLVLGGGVRLGIGRLQISPELRYTHWNNTPINFQSSGGFVFQSSQNQVDLLVGLGWKLH